MSSPPCFSLHYGRGKRIFKTNVSKRPAITGDLLCGSFLLVQEIKDKAALEVQKTAALTKYSLTAVRCSGKDSGDLP